LIFLVFQSHVELLSVNKVSDILIKVHLWETAKKLLDVILERKGHDSCWRHRENFWKFSI